MSWDLDIEVTDIDGNTHRFEVIDSQTYNLTPMWSKALAFLDVTRDFDEKFCSDISAALKVGLIDIMENWDEYRKLEPDNGWGDLDGFFRAYVELTRNCLKYPSGKLVWAG
jgi:hypothetical protein